MTARGRHHDALTKSFRPGSAALPGYPGGTGQRRQHSRGGSDHRFRLAGAAAVDGTPGTWSSGAAAASRPATPRSGARRATSQAGVSRGTVYTSGTRQVRRGLVDRRRRYTAGWVAAGLVCVAAMPTAAVARPFWGAPASMALLGLALIGAASLLLAVPTRSLPPTDEDGAS